MITEDYVSFDTAKLLKEKGFDAECHSYYFPYYEDREMTKKNYERQRGMITLNDRHLYAVNTAKDLPKDHYLCPTLQMAMKWLREKHNVLILIDKPNSEYRWRLRNNTYGDYVKGTGRSNSYNGVCEGALKYCLENLI